MLGILLLYFIGKPFYELAELHQRNRWGFAILAIATYYAGTFIAGIVLALFMNVDENGSIGGMSEMMLAIIALPFGLLACWLLYTVLKKQWERNNNSDAGDALDGDLISK